MSTTIDSNNSSVLYDISLLVLVGLLWGATNPFIRLGSKGINKVKSKSRIKQIYLELKFLATKWDYTIPFILNQSGSIVYIIALQNSSLSVTVPVANALTFVFTAISSHLLGEKIEKTRTYIGGMLIALGSSLCIMDKS